jgi:hypothetical protein
MSSDLGHVLSLRRMSWSVEYSTPVPEMGYMLWQSEEDERTPTNGTRLIDWGTWADTTQYEGEYLREINTTIINMLVAVRDAIQ